MMCLVTNFSHELIDFCENLFVHIYILGITMLSLGMWF